MTNSYLPQVAQVQVTQVFVTANPEEIITNFVNALANVAPSTRATYARNLRNFFAYLKETKTTNPDRQTIIDYKNHLMNQCESGKITLLTICSYINSLRGFFQHLYNAGLYPHIARGIDAPRHTTTHKKQHIEMDKITELLTHYQTTESATALRDFAIINLLLRSGLRTAELVNIDINDITYIGSTRVIKIKGKGHNEKDDYIVLTDKMYAPIAEYLNERGIYNEADPLFSSTSNHKGASGNRLTTRTIRNIVRSGLDAIGLTERCFTAHSLRHTTAVNILECGGGLEEVRNVLRHKSINTSRIYVESFNKMNQLKNINNKLDNLF